MSRHVHGRVFGRTFLFTLISNLKKKTTNVTVHADTFATMFPNFLICKRVHYNSPTKLL